MKAVKPTLVLLPGTHGNGLLFGPLVQALRGWKVLVLEYPEDSGWGLNGYVDWLDAQLKKERKTILVAESFGSLVAVRYAAKRPKTLVGLVTLGGFVRSPKRWARPWMRHLMLGPNNGLSKFLGRHFLIGMNAGARKELLLDQALGRMSKKDLLDRVEIILESDERAALKKIQVPIVALVGLWDRLVASASGDDFVGARRIVLLAPHAMALFREDQIRDAIKNLI